MTGGRPARDARGTLIWPKRGRGASRAAVAGPVAGGKLPGGRGGKVLVAAGTAYQRRRITRASAEFHEAARLERRLGFLHRVRRGDRHRGIERHVANGVRSVIETPTHPLVIRNQIENAEAQLIRREHGLLEALAEVAIGQPHALTPKPPAHIGARAIVVVPLAIADTERDEGQPAKVARGVADAFAGQLGNSVGIDRIRLGRGIERRTAEAMAGEDPVGAGEYHAANAGAARCLDDVVRRVDVVVQRRCPGSLRAGIAREMQHGFDADKAARPVVVKHGEVSRFDRAIAAELAIDQGEHPSEGLHVAAEPGAESARGAGDQDMGHGNLADRDETCGRDAISSSKGYRRRAGKQEDRNVHKGSGPRRSRRYRPRGREPRRW